MSHESRVARRLLVAAVLLLPVPLRSQSLTLRLVEDSTRQMLPGVVVRLLVGSRVVVTGLTGESGRVTLTAPAPGHYDLTASRIGHEGFGPLPIDLAAGSQARVIVMPRAVRMLPPIVVTKETRCNTATGSGTAAAALWEDIRTALTANALTASEGRVLLTVSRFQRELTPEREFVRERMTRRHQTRGQPFVSEDPGQLMTRGFVYHDGDSLHYAAPDAALLLTDEFVEGHCFAARSTGASGPALGLAFEPVPGRKLADVRGTLWLDPTSRELRHLEFTYTGLDKEEGLGNPGGRIDFERLENGAWIVREWTLMMPRVGRIRSVAGQPELPPDRYKLLGWIVAVGRAEVGVASASAADVVSELSGRVLDSLYGGPLVGARVLIDGEPDSTVTDSTGRFRLTVRGSGIRLLRVEHARLGIVPDNSTQEVRLAADQPAVVTVSVPPVERFGRTLCADELGAAGVLGMVLGDDGTPREGVTVRASWNTMVTRVALDSRYLETKSGARGIYTFCALPPRTTIKIDWARRQTTVSVDRGSFRWLELPLSPAINDALPQMITIASP